MSYSKADKKFDKTFFLLYFVALIILFFFVWFDLKKQNKKTELEEFIKIEEKYKKEKTNNNYKQYTVGDFYKRKAINDEL